MICIIPQPSHSSPDFSTADMFSNAEENIAPPAGPLQDLNRGIRPLQPGYDAPSEETALTSALKMSIMGVTQRGICSGFRFQSVAAQGRTTMSDEMNIRNHASSVSGTVLALVVLSLLVHAPAKGQGHAEPGGTIVAFGDSLTAGYGVSPEEAYPARLENKLRASGCPWRVINAGISGETSSGALRRVPSVLRLKPDIVVLETGVNDTMPGMDPATTGRNIEEIVRILQDNRVTVVLAGMRRLKGQERDPAFEKLYPVIARKYNLVLVPFFLANVAGNPALNLEDGIHPTAEGYRRVTRTIYPYIKKAIRQQVAVSLSPAQ
jgi:acyl-CoA thioesterase I